MRSEDKTSRRIAVLRDSVARKIAAGEVIDRPFSVVRELVDNAIDAGADDIEVEVAAGGVKLVRVRDNGRGMTPEDLEICWLPHATSKITSEDDLLTTASLGFRGEALSSIGHVARLSITSVVANGEPHRLLVDQGTLVELSPSQSPPGTTVEVEDLFYAYPARKRFLKRPQSESAACRTVAVDRALAFPGVSFRFIADGKDRLVLPATDTLSRVAQACLEPSQAPLLFTATGTGDGFSVEIVMADPGLVRRDRRRMGFFVNGRRLSDYGMMQAIEHGYAGYVAGGLYPVCYVFVDMDPSLVDFNIHPAKKEARFRAYGDLHHRVASLVARQLEAVSQKRASHYSPAGAVPDHDTPGSGQQSPGGRPLAGRVPSGRSRVGQPLGGQGSGAGHPHPDHAVDWSAFESPDRASAWAAGTNDSPADTTSAGQSSEFSYLGSLGPLFLLAEYRGGLIAVDKHAAHERLLFDRLRRRPGSQPLLVPLAFDLEADDSRHLERVVGELEETGIVLRRVGNGAWELVAVPAGFAGTEAAIVRAIRDHVSTEKALATALFADLACKAAVKDGDYVDETTAMSIIEGVLELDTPRCPHGRPIYFELSYETMLRGVGREPDGTRPHDGML